MASFFQYNTLSYQFFVPALSVKPVNLLMKWKTSLSLCYVRHRLLKVPQSNTPHLMDVQKSLRQVRNCSEAKYHTCLSHSSSPLLFWCGVTWTYEVFKQRWGNNIRLALLKGFESASDKKKNTKKMMHLVFSHSLHFPFVFRSVHI